MEQLGGTAAASDSNELETMESPMSTSMSNALRMNMTACLATGFRAGQAAAEWIKRNQ